MVGLFLVLTAGWFIYVMFKTIWEMSCEVRQNREEQFIVLTLQDREDVAEGLVRTIVCGKLAHNPNINLKLVDAGSEDTTPLILERMSTRYRLGFSRADSSEAELKRF